MKRAKQNWIQATKKKPVRPRRDEPPQLTDEDREDEASQAIEKALIHLKEAEEMAPWGKAPNACAHAAYYAMYFVAVAALFRAGGVGKRKSVPESHEHVLQHYIKLAERQPAPLRDSGMTLNRARDLRIESDYFINDEGTHDYGMHGASRKDAQEMTEKAREMMEGWTAVWNKRYT